MCHGPPVPVTVFSIGAEMHLIADGFVHMLRMLKSHVCAISDLLICLITFHSVSPHMFAQTCLIVHKPTVPVSLVSRA